VRQENIASEEERKKAEEELESSNEQYEKDGRRCIWV
jgi:hypothetical protein